MSHGWYVVNAENKVLGRLASQIAARLRGKHKPEYTPHVDTGDFIVVVNAAKIRVTGKKALGQEVLPAHRFPRRHQRDQLRQAAGAAIPSACCEKAVKGMLPKGPLGYAMLRKLKVYAAGTHPHTAQQPKALEV